MPQDCRTDLSIELALAHRARAEGHAHVLVEVDTYERVLLAVRDTCFGQRGERGTFRVDVAADRGLVWRDR